MPFSLQLKAIALGMGTFSGSRHASEDIPTCMHVRDIVPIEHLDSSLGAVAG